MYRISRDCTQVQYMYVLSFQCMSESINIYIKVGTSERSTSGDDNDNAITSSSFVLSIQYGPSQVNTWRSRTKHFEIDRSISSRGRNKRTRYGKETRDSFRGRHQKIIANCCLEQQKKRQKRRKPSPSMKATIDWYTKYRTEFKMDELLPLVKQLTDPEQVWIPPSPTFYTNRMSFFFIQIWIEWSGREKQTSFYKDFSLGLIGCFFFLFHFT